MEHTSEEYPPLVASKPCEDSPINKFCRLCLCNTNGTSDNKLQLVPLDSTVRNVALPEMIASITGRELVQLGDDCPQVLCMSCLRKVDYCYKFRKDLLKAYDALNSFHEGSMIENLLKYEKLQTIEIKENTLKFKTTDVKSEEQEPDSLTTKRQDDKVPKSDDEEDLPENESNNDEEKNVKSTKSRRRIKLPKAKPEGYKHLETKIERNKCYICGEFFEKPSDVEQHLVEHKDMVPYNCEECSIGLPYYQAPKTVASLHKHMRMHAALIKCPKCPFRALNGNALANHKSRYHNEKLQGEFTCEVCGKVLPKKIMLKHMRDHRALNQERNRCSICEKKFTTGQRLVRHMRQHTGERPFQCRYCEKTFKTKTCVSIHERIHTGEKGYQCAECSTCFSTKQRLDDHMIANHAAPGRPRITAQVNKTKIYICPIEGCDYARTGYGNFYHHKAKHEPKFQCSECPKRYPTRQALDHHMFVHTGEKHYCCELCGKKFRVLQSLVYHMADHKNIRKHKCDICGMAFVRKNTLAMHLLKHQDTLNYACRYCHKKYRYPGDLSKHERSCTIENQLQLKFEVESPPHFPLGEEEYLQSEDELQEEN
ncbi:zinc finger protein 62 homolog [Uranotaenia lowii]|uniref:zinc finger protein 62 homolog n=1 Tax=Uranotaenia lowii TaxID=190385 RepID=UPI002479ECB0|nr:zinc finger protein 62 homolog [Uranotaenia lowii]